VRDAGAEPPQRAAQHGYARRPVGLGHVQLDREAGDDQHPARAAQSAGRVERRAGIEERRHVAMAGIEGENLVDEVDTTSHGSGRYHRLASYSKHW
jgi:uncharacterized glyoxalase superfamily metalloenzyme YdcJ